MLAMDFAKCGASTSMIVFHFHSRRLCASLGCSTLKQLKTPSSALVTARDVSPQEATTAFVKDVNFTLPATLTFTPKFPVCQLRPGTTCPCKTTANSVGPSPESCARSPAMPNSAPLVLRARASHWQIDITVWSGVAADPVPRPPCTTRCTRTHPHACQRTQRWDCRCEAQRTTIRCPNAAAVPGHRFHSRFVWVHRCKRHEYRRF
mmetsp:Transcript_53052/g.121045  ORF Transcript_53052/g.121045 Transcript_53052/m.121045 type:complete len:206 (-) Transcript_53052:611-1228(-)